MHILECYKSTQDDWYPCFKLGNTDLVRVRLSLLGPGNPPLPYRVSVWGADDCGMERDVSNFEYAKMIFNKIIECKYVNRQFLKEQKFVMS